MKKIVVILLLAMSVGMAYASPTPTPPPNSQTEDGQVIVNVLRNLSIQTLNCCGHDLPHIIVDTEISITDKAANFRIIGQPGYDIIITANGSPSTAYPGSTEFVVNGVTMTGRWGKYDDGKKPSLFEPTPAFTVLLPDNLSGAYDPNDDASWVDGTIYCAFKVDHLKAAAGAPLGDRTFVLIISAEYAI